MKKKIFEKYSIILLVFLTGSFIGFLHENLLEVLQGYYRLKQGLIYEPLIPVYGFGALLFYFIYKDLNMEKKSCLARTFIVFAIAFVMGAGIEYFLSFAQEKIFGTISWNYTNLKFNLNGRTSLFHGCFWGLTGILFYRLLLPFIKKVECYLQGKPHRLAIIILSTILFLDCTISTVACLRHTRRREGILPQNYIERFLDEHYPDDYLKRIYPTARVPKR